MPNREGGYGGYQNKPDKQRQIHAPGTGGVRRISPENYGQPREQNRRQPRQSAQRPSAKEAARRPRTGRPEPDTRRTTYRAPNRKPLAEDADGWIRPPQPPRRRPDRPQADPARDVLQELARRARRDRKLRRRLALLATVVCILLAAGIITAILPDTPSGATPESAQGEAAGLTASLVAPLPYANAGQADEAAAVDWGDVGPVRQEGTVTLTAAPAAPGALPAFGKVDLSWFADAAFLGDSLTVGFTEYDIDVSGALVCAYEGATPSQIVNRSTMNSQVRGEEIPLDVLAANQPKKLYVLLGANALAYSTGNDEGFLNYYSRLLDELKTALPNTMIFVQSVLPVQAEAVADMPGLAPERVAAINASLQSLAAEKGCYYLALNEVFSDDGGNLISDYAQPDGLHLSGSGYSTWVDYLRTHTPYSKDNPYQLGSEYYLDDEMKALLSDIP